MEITFNVDNIPAVLTDSAWTGQMELTAGGTTTVIQSLWSLRTHFSYQVTSAWTTEVSGHQVFIERTRQFWLSALRERIYRIKVDGKLVAEQTSN